MESPVFQSKDIESNSGDADFLALTKAALSNVVTGAQKNSFTAELGNDAYHAHRAFISHSGMLKLLRSPAHYFEYLHAPREESSPNIGTAAHAALLEPDAFARDYVSYAGYRKGKAWDEFKEANSTKIILNVTEHEAVQGMVNAVNAFDEYPLRAALDLGEPEKSIFWIDEETGVGCRIRVDNLTPFVIFDLKTFNDVRPNSVARQAASMEYDLQAYMYTEGVRAFTGKTLPFYFIFIETGRPHGVWMYKAGQTLMRNGEIKFRRGLRAFKALQQTGDWHGYKNAVTELELPRYAILDDADSDLLSRVS